MNKPLDSNPKNAAFVPAGSVELVRHVFANEELEKKRRLSLTRHHVSAMALAEGEEEPPKTDAEQPVYFRLNQTGNIFYSTTTQQITGATKDLFDSVTVLFSAMTSALAQKNKDLFDYDAWGSLIRKSGYFIEVQKFSKNLVIEDNSITIDTQIVQQLLPGLTTGSSMDIAKSVLNALNGKYSLSTTTEDTKFAHLLFICEELFGAPSVTVRLFYATKKSHTTLTSSPCSKTSSTKLEQSQEADTFLFVDPQTIAKFAATYTKTNDDYQKLIKKLGDLVS